MEEQLQALLERREGADRPHRIEFVLRQVLPRATVQVLRRGEVSGEAAARMNSFLRRVVLVAADTLQGRVAGAGDTPELLEAFVRIVTPTPLANFLSRHTRLTEPEASLMPEPMEVAAEAAEAAEAVEDREAVAGAALHPQLREREGESVARHLEAFLRRGGLRGVLARLRSGGSGGNARPSLEMVRTCLDFVLRCRELLAAEAWERLARRVRALAQALLLGLSDEELKQAERRTLQECVAFAQELLRGADPRAADALLLSVVAKMLRAPTLEKRLAGISDLRELVLPFLAAPNASTTPAGGGGGSMGGGALRLHSTSAEELRAWLREQRVLEEVFGPSMHPELVRRAGDLVKFAAGEARSLERPLLDLLWDAAVRHATLAPAVHDVLVQLASFLAPADLDYLWNTHVRQMSLAALAEPQMLQLLRNFTAHALYARSLRPLAVADSVPEYGLEQLWQVATATVVGPRPGESDFALASETRQMALQALVEILSNWAAPFVPLVRVFEERALEALRAGGRPVPAALQVLRGALEGPRHIAPHAYSKLSDALLTLERERGLMSLLLGELEAYLSRTGAQEADAEAEVRARLEFVQYVLTGSGGHLRLSAEQLHRLWGLLVPRGPPLSDLLFRWLEGLLALRVPAAGSGTSEGAQQQQQPGGPLEEEAFEQLLAHALPSLPATDLSGAAFSLLELAFGLLNWRAGALVRPPDPAHQQPLEAAQPHALQGLELVWRAALQSRDPQVGQRAVQLLTGLHRPLLTRPGAEWSAYLDACRAGLRDAVPGLRGGRPGAALAVERALALLRAFLDEQERLRGEDKAGGVEGSGGEARVSVWVIQGGRFELEMRADDTVATLRRRVAERIGLEPCALRLVNNGREMKALRDTLRKWGLHQRPAAPVYVTRRPPEAIEAARRDEEAQLAGSEASAPSQAAVQASAGSGAAAAETASVAAAVAGNDEWFELLFGLLTSGEEDLSARAWELLERLPRNPRVLEQLSRLEGEAWRGLLTAHSAYGLLYALRVLETLLAGSGYAAHFEERGGLACLVRAALDAERLLVPSPPGRRAFALLLHLLGTFLLPPPTSTSTPSPATATATTLSAARVAEPAAAAPATPTTATGAPSPPPPPPPPPRDLAEDPMPGPLRLSALSAGGISPADLTLCLLNACCAVTRLPVPAPTPATTALPVTSSNGSSELTQIAAASEPELLRPALRLLCGLLQADEALARQLAEQEAELGVWLRELLLESGRGEEARRGLATLARGGGAALEGTMLRVLAAAALALHPPAAWRHRCAPLFSLLVELIARPSALLASRLDRLELLARAAEQVARADDWGGDPSANSTDELLEGLLRLCEALMTAARSGGESQVQAMAAAAAASETERRLAQGLTEVVVRLVFETPNAEQVMQAEEGGRPAPPCCKTRRTRQAAFALLRACARTDADLAQMVCEQLVRVQGGPELRALWNYLPAGHERASCGYVGLKNLGATCYMNSLLQQFYMVPALRQSVLAARLPADPTPANADAARSSSSSSSSNESEKEARAVLREVQSLFGHLQESAQRAYVPALCAVLRDASGEAVNPAVQQDADEFFNLLLDRLERGLRVTRQAYALRRAFGGLLAGQILSQECGHTAERDEAFYSVSLEVKGRRGLLEALDAYVQGDLLDGDNKWACSTCQAKVRALKRVCLRHLPNTLVLHLKRFEFDFETMHRVKLHDQFEFPLELDMEPYTCEGLARREGKPLPQSAEGRPPSYYRYRLVGVLVHSGSADSGHYYSFVKERHSERWLCFNDTSVEEWDPRELPRQCFGGYEPLSAVGGASNKEASKLLPRSYSAYMLFYEREFHAPPPFPVAPVSRPPEELEAAAEAEAATAPRVLTRREEAALVPSEVYAVVWRENRDFFRDRALHDPDYYALAWDCVKIGFALVPPGRDVSVLDLACRFLFDTLMHGRERASLRPAVEALRDRLLARPDLAALLLGRLAASTSTSASGCVVEERYHVWLRQLLFACPVEEVREAFVTVVLAALKARRALDAPLAYAALTPAGMLVSVLVDAMLPEAPQHWRNFAQFFQLLGEFAAQGREERARLLDAFLVPRLVDLLLPGDDSPLRSSPRVLEALRAAGMPELPAPRKMGDRATSPNLAPAIACLACLVRSCRLRVATRPSPAALLPPEGLLALRPAEEELLLERDANVLYRLVRLGQNSQALGELLQHVCWENEELSQQLIEQLCRGVHTLEYTHFPPLFAASRALLLQLHDSLQARRLESFLSAFLKVVALNTRFRFATAASLLHLAELARGSVHARLWLLGHLDLWLAHYLLDNPNPNVRDVVADHLLPALLPALPAPDACLCDPRCSALLYPSPSLSPPTASSGAGGSGGGTEPLSETHVALLRAVLGLLVPIRLRCPSDAADQRLTAEEAAAQFRAVQTFRALRFLCPPDLARLWEPLIAAQLDAFTAALEAIDLAQRELDLNKREAVRTLYHWLLASPSLRLQLARHERSRRIVELWVLLRVHETSFYFNQSYLPYFYGSVLLLARADPRYTEMLCSHQNFDWAWKNVLLSPEYTQAHPHLRELMRLCGAASREFRAQSLEHLAALPNERLHLSGNHTELVGCLADLCEPAPAGPFAMLPAERRPRLLELVSQWLGQLLLLARRASAESHWRHELPGLRASVATLARLALRAIQAGLSAGSALQERLFQAAALDPSLASSPDLPESLRSLLVAASPASSSTSSA